MLTRMSRGEAPKPTPNSNQFVMQRAKEAAERMGLTLEMVFRAADLMCSGSVSLEDLKLFLKKAKFRLAPAQMSRFLFLVDEDCSGSVSRNDFYATLAAYGVNSETQWAQGSHFTFEQQCLLKFARVLKNQGMKPEEVFRYCDPKQLGKIENQALYKFVDSTLRTEFKEREKFALVAYLDLGKVGSIERKHFMKELEKAIENLNTTSDTDLILNMSDRRDINARPAVSDKDQITNSLFKSDLNVTGDQGLANKNLIGGVATNLRKVGGNGPSTNAPGSRISAGSNAQGPNPASNLSENEIDTIQGVINKIEKVSPMGRFLLEILNACEIQESSIINIDDFNRYLSAR